MMKAPNRTLNPCNHYTTIPLVINICDTRIDLTKKANPCKAQSRTQARME
jgi:hypothetical protein